MPHQDLTMGLQLLFFVEQPSHYLYVYYFCSSGDSVPFVVVVVVVIVLLVVIIYYPILHSINAMH